MRSFKHVPAQTMVVFAILSKIFDLFEGAFRFVYVARCFMHSKYCFC